jgi:hypothetical protein
VSARIAAVLLTCATAVCAQQSDDAVLGAMQAELERSKTLQLPNLQPPYFIEYAVDSAKQFNVTATLGAMVSKNDQILRLGRVQVRVGSPEFDNTNYIYSDLFGSASGRLPDENDEALLRRQLWLLSDQAYKGAVEGIARKQAALRNVTQQETIADLASADPVNHVEPLSDVEIDQDAWTRLARELSAKFAGYPDVLGSSVSFQSSVGAAYMANSEGSLVRTMDDLFRVTIQAAGQAPDGMPVRDSWAFESRGLDGLPAEQEMQGEVERVAKNVIDLTKAPVGEDYSGPVLVEGVASAQLFAQLLGEGLGLSKRPVSDPGRAAPYQASDLQGRKGSRVLPEFMDVVDDPTQETYRGRPLFGYYEVDVEGVIPQPLPVVEDGRLNNFLLTRQPVRGFEKSNGRARLPGSFGAKAAIFSNLFIRAKETAPVSELKQRMLQMVEQRGLPYGLILRKLDYPSTATVSELRQLSQESGERGVSGLVSLPVLVYRLYPDGREELVRGLQFRGVTSRSLRDIIAAGDDETLFDFLQNGAPLARQGGGTFVTGSTVAAPSVLFEDLELEKRTEDWPTLPVVPPPPLTSRR